MKVSGLDLSLLAAFEAMMEEGSVTGAVRRLGVGQPATSAALWRLRLAFGDELVLRTADGMRPTPCPKELAPGVSAALAQVRRTLEAGAVFTHAMAAKRFSAASTDYNWP